MYLTHFGLNQLPFGITPDPSFFFSGNKRGEILSALIYAVEQGDGIIKVTGEVGSGKTMLCRMLESQLPDYVEVIYLVNPTLTREQVIYTIAGELDLPVGSKRVDEVIRLLHTALIEKHISGKRVVLLVEEAQAMSLSTLEEIRLFSNLETAHHKLLQIVLFGQPELDEHLNLASMRQLKERITNSFKVPPLTSTNVPEYLKFRLRAAGCQTPDLFSPAASKLIGTVSEGIVRRISILADKSLLAAFADNANTVTPSHVRVAIRDSEFPRYNVKRIGRQVALPGLALALLIALGLRWPGHNPWPSSHAATPPAAPVVVIKTAAPPLGPAPVARAPMISAVTPLQAVVPVSAPAPVTDPLEQRIAQSSDWLHQQSPDHYSVQIALIASKDQADVSRILHKMETEMGLQDIYVYTVRASASPHFGILYGSYATRAEALAMLNQLTTRWGYQAQLRTFGGIGKETGGG